MRRRMAALALLASAGSLLGCGANFPESSAALTEVAPRDLMAAGTLPPGHPPVPGHGYSHALPEGHPPIPGLEAMPELPEGHPRCPARGVQGDFDQQVPAAPPQQIIST